MIEINHLRRLVIAPALAPFPPAMRTDAAVELLVGTAIVESLVTMLKQGLRRPDDGLGVALGIYQMEPSSHLDLFKNYLAFKPDLAKLVSTTGIRPDRDLITDLAYATRVARLHYYRVPEQLPLVGDIQGLARYWKQYYNTPLGKGKIEEFIDLYKRFA